MAYVDQALKTKINAELKKVIPKDYKWSLSVSNYSTLVLTFQSGKAELLADIAKQRGIEVPAFSDPELATLFQNIVATMNSGNHNKSRIEEDYFDVGWYIRVNIGTYARPYMSPQSIAARV